MPSPTTLRAFTAIGLAALLAGCAPTPPEAEPTPTFATEAEAFAAAEETYRAYVDALNQVDLSDPETFENLWGWTAGDLNAADRKSLTGYHSDGVEMEGKSLIAAVAPASELYPESIRLRVCLDVESFVLLSESGASLTPDDRADVLSLTVSLIRSPDSPTGLLIDALAPREGEPKCAP